MSPPAYTIVARGVVTPEGPAEDERGDLYFVQRKVGLSRVSVVSEGAWRDVVDTHGKAQSVAVEPSGSLLVPDAVKAVLLRVTPEGDVTIVCDRCEGEPLLGPNDLVLLPDGGVLMTDPGMSFDPPGAILWIDTECTAHKLTEDMCFPNGIALREDGRTLLVAESAKSRIEEFEWREAAVSKRRTFCELPGDAGPDGIAFDREGNLYVACNFTGTVTMIDPSGRIVDELSPGGGHPTNCTFGGPDFATLFVTEDEAGQIVSFERDVPGQVPYSRSRPRAAVGPSTEKGGDS